MEFLADLFQPERVIFVSDVDGLFDDNPKSNKDAKLIENVNHDVLDNVKTNIDVADVTGGVRGKMEAMLRMCSSDRDCILLNGNVKDRLYNALIGNEVTGTRATGGQQ